MKKLLVLAVLSTLPILAFGQVMGGAAYRSDYSQKKNSSAAAISELKQFRRNGGMVIDATVLMNLKPQHGLAVVAISDSATTVAEARRKLTERRDLFARDLAALGIPGRDIDNDFISQNRNYSYNVDRKEALASEYVSGYTIKENIAIRFQDKKLLSKILDIAAKYEIFDLVKYDEVVLSTQQIRQDLFAKASEMIKARAAVHERLLGNVKIRPKAVLMNEFSTYIPGDFYSNYNSSEGDQLQTFYNMNITRLARPRTQFYDPIRGEDYDLVINPSILEPVVQATYLMSMQYEVVPAPAAAKQTKKKSSPSKGKRK
jgi:uncharacterized protein YggE